MVKFKHLVAKHYKLEDDVAYEGKLTQDTEGLKIWNLKDLAWVERLLWQSSVVNCLDEKQGQRIEKEVKDQAATNLAREVFEVEESVGACEIGDRDHRVQKDSQPGMTLLLLVNTF